MLSRQRKWQLKQNSLGKCQLCLNSLGIYKAVCDYHAKLNRIRHRNINGWKPKKAEGRGRPILSG